MMHERGIVTKVENGFAFVRKPQSRKCENCSGKGSCMVLEHGGEVLVKVKNTFNAHPGDEVGLKIGQPPSGLQRLSLFLVAAVALIGGGAGGKFCSRFTITALGQFLPAIFGLGSLTITVLLWQRRSKHQKQRQSQPIMEKIIHRES